MAKINKKVGLFLCKCGTNISDSVEFNEIELWLKNKPEVCFIEKHELLCSPEGKKAFEDIIIGNEADTVVIAACSPKMNQTTFQEAAANAGMNMANVHMANIREHCAWVTRDSTEATHKAKAIINAAIKRSIHHEELEFRSMPCCSDVVIIGGGIAGIETALMVAKDGRKAYLIEKDISLGGNIIKTEEIAPVMECAPCVLAPRLSEISENDHIEVIANAEVSDILGFFGNFTVKVKQKARFVNDLCIGCEACFEACPVSVKSDFHCGLGNRKAVYTAFPGSVPDAAVIDKDNCKHFSDGSCDDACVEMCPFEAIDFNEKDQDLEIKAGAIVLATGFHSVDPTHAETLGYGKIDNVYTMPEFERMASSNGPYEGTIQTKDKRAPLSVAVIHCANSLSSSGVPYCSGICCMTALKVGELVRKQIPDAKIFNIHDRLVLDGPDMYEFYHKQVLQGTQFVKCNNLSSVLVKQDNTKISISADNIDTISADMVILSTGVAPSNGTSQLAKLLNIDLNKYGFFKPDHNVLHSTGTTRDGIYAAGCCNSPSIVSSTITRAHAVVGDILSKLIPGKEIELEVMTATIDPEVCAGCKLCISVCPYKAITFDHETMVSVLNEAICRGCGTCAATCPSGAATAKHFTDEQIYAEIGGMFHD